MIYLLILLLSAFSFASKIDNWSNVFEIVEKHEFYKNNEVITRPKDSIETIMGVVYLDSNLNKFKDCVFYKVPGEERGILKIKTIQFSKSCDEFKLSPGDEEYKEIKSFQFFDDPQTISIQLIFDKFKEINWKLPKLNNRSEFNDTLLLLSNPQTITPDKRSFLKKGSVCQEVGDDCIVKSGFNCQKCESGWIELPNGCKVGPKICSDETCGYKDAPACRRGMTYQRVNKKYECRIDNSFAYCAEGLSIQCEGAMAYCR